MKLPDFTKNTQLNTLRQLMGALLGEFTPAENRDVLTPAEIEALTTRGIDVSLDDVHTLFDGTLAYKNSRVILYIRDVTYYRDSDLPNLPRFHVADCRTLETMRANKRFERYVVATRDDGLFPLNVISPNEWSGSVKSVTERLPVCQNCLTKLKWDGFAHGMDKLTRREIVDQFRISRFFDVYGKTLVNKAPKHDATTAPLNTYPTDFGAVGERIKTERGYRCDRCGIDLTNHRKFLHAHHKDGQKHDTRPENIAVLCVACHAEQFNHSHLKGTPGYVEFLRVRPSILASRPASMMSRPVSSSTQQTAVPNPELPSPGVATPRLANWVVVAQDLARMHKLGMQDLRKDGGCVWVALKNPGHPVAIELRKLGFQFSPKRQAFWRKK